MIISIAKNIVLAAGGAVATGQNGTPSIASLGSPQLGMPTKLVIAVETNAATTITVNLSYDDGKTWIPAIYSGTAGTVVSIVLTGAGSAVVDVPPAPYVQIVSSGACTLTAWAYTV